MRNTTEKGTLGQEKGEQKHRGLGIGGRLHYET